MKLLPILFLAVAPLLASGASIEGEVALPFTKDGFGKDNFQKEFGDAVKAKTNWHVGEFFGQETVFAGIAVKNTASKSMSVHYFVAFFDKNGKLIGSTGQGSFDKEGLKPGEETQMASCLIHLPKDKYKEIKSYQAVIYEFEPTPKN